MTREKQLKTQAPNHRSMGRRRIIVAAAVIVVAVGWYLFRPELLFVSRSVNEQFPGASNQPMTANASPTMLSEGTFHGVAHETKGTAAVYQLPDGKRVLRFTQFETSNGPDVQVYLVAAADANDNETVTQAGFIHLGPLKGTNGDQNYELPADADLNTYQAVTIWCRRFGVNFGTAPLKHS